MARRGWGGSIATAIGVAAGAGAAQLGFGYGLGIINWAPADPGAGPASWVASLVWATWIAATSTVFGAVCAQRLRDRGTPSRPPVDPRADDASPAADPTPGTGTADPDAGPEQVGPLRLLLLALAAGAGALITVLLVAVPARMAEVADTPSPREVAAGYAAVGVLVGVLTATWALRSRAAAANVIATIAWLWLLAVVAVVDGVLAGRGLTSAQLGIWQLSADDGRYWIRDYLYWPGAVLSLGSALVIGALAARGAARHPDHRVGAVASGAAGPLLVAVAYFLAVPRVTAISPEQVSAHLIAPYAVIVGVGGSALVAALAQRAARRSAPTAPAAVEPAPATPAEPRSTDPVGSGTARVPRQRAGRTVRPPAVGDPATVGAPDPTTVGGTAVDPATTGATGTEPATAGGPSAAPTGDAKRAGTSKPAGGGDPKPAGGAGTTGTDPATPAGDPEGAAAGDGPAGRRARSTRRPR
ncbi:hypothetical protein Q3W71_27725 [Micromonospora sp. C28SCA-DRY-2]|uniref:hypothetical protein n=1 Tax=Micromonospora sp. C28SCA-DRY-2 TaxID=3059522 RepID=UPI0026756A20|nr:hypothetical protein [Micromonospora sp. C28SCA-DRY-2]MDO3705466.1 hypothetical protein [Micromonospora sp. C28SCA-DRY-2]